MRKQQGVVWWVYALVALFVFGAGTAIVLAYNSAIAKAEKLTAENTTLSQSLKDQLDDNMWLRVENTRVNGLLAAREAGRQAAKQERDRLDAKLADIFKNDPAARDWRDQPIPDSLRLKPSGELDKDRAPAATGKPAR